jgi:hypothetical protein
MNFSRILVLGIKKNNARLRPIDQFNILKNVI